MWRLRIEQYFQVQDYALWDVIENGNSFKPAAQTTTNANGTSTSLIPGPVTTEEKVQKKNDVKARSMLLMALSNERLMTFNQYKDVKTLFAAIQTRFSGNEATKKTQKTLLKQMYKNFSAPSTESLDSIFNRLQKIVNQLAILGENISQEDLNLKFLKSLLSEWNTHVVVWRNKPNLDITSFDDLYNNFKIVEQEVKRTANSSSISTANTQVSPASTQVSTASTQVSTANLSVATVYAFLASQPNGSQFVYEDLEQIHKDELEEMDLKWQLALLSMRTRRGPRNQDSRNMNQDNSRRTVNVEETSSKAMVAIDGVVHNDKTCSKTCLKSFETLKTQLDDLRIEFNKSEFNLATYKRGLASVEEQLVFYKKNEVIFCEQLAVLKRDISYKDSEISMLKRLFSPPNLDLSYSGLEEESPNAPLVKELVLDDKLKKKTIFPTIAKIEFVRPKQQEKPVRKPADSNYHQRERVVSGNDYTRVNYNYSTKKAHPSAYRNMASRAVLMKTSLRPLNNARTVNTAHPKTTVYSARQMSRFSKSAQSTGHPQKEDQGYVDSGCSRHMTVNMSYLSNFKEFDRGYVTFGGGAKGGKIWRCLADESQVLLKVPRKNNMYSVDMKNIVPKESLTCLVVKATLGESMLWHRRLGHVFFKTINKLVKENLVRGLPSKSFENDQTCVACLKRKQHKASYLRGFFLASKDETSGILKNFITDVNTNNV
ncbi:ribonuclease H-like domain-containing protein [Tanacetum coccineum]